MIRQNQETAQICITNLHPEKVVAFEKKSHLAWNFVVAIAGKGTKRQ